MKSRSAWVAMILTGIVVVLIYYAYDPAASRWFPRCPFLLLTGLQCPGCGSQRAVHSLLHLDVMSALHYNSLLVVSLPAVLFLCYVELMRERRPRLYTSVHRPAVIWTVFTLFMLWWIGRNVILLCK